MLLLLRVGSKEGATVDELQVGTIVGAAVDGLLLDTTVGDRLKACTEEGATVDGL